MDGNQFRSFIKDIWGEDSEAYSKLGNANTDWQKEIFRAAVSTDHNLTISGGLKICLTAFLSVIPIRTES